MNVKPMNLLLLMLLALATNSHAQQNFIAKSSYNEELESRMEKTAPEKKSDEETNSFQFLITPNFIYWHVSEDFLDIFTGAPVVESNAASSLHSYPIHLSYHPGLKISFGFSQPEHSWSLGLDYTYLLSHNKKLFSPKNTFGIFGSDWFRPFFTGTIVPGSFIKAKWSFLLNELDGSFCYLFVPNVHWSFKPYLGLKALWVDQKYRIKTLLISSTDSSMITPLSQNKSDSWGIGPRFGADLDCSLGKGIHFLGSAAFSLLYQEFSVHHFNSAINFEGNESLSSSIKSSPHKLCPYLETKLGLSYDFPLHKKFHLNLSGLYEFHFVEKQQQMHAALAENPHLNGKSAGAGNLYMHGLTMGLQFCW